MLAAVYSHPDPERTMMLRGISDFGDKRKNDLDEIGKGGLRRYAARNAIRLLWGLMEAGVLPRAEQPVIQTGDRVASGQDESTPDLPALALSPLERLALIETLSALPGAQFSKLLFALKPSAGVVPDSRAPQGDRAAALLEWAESPSGPGISPVQDMLNLLISPQ